MHKKKEIGSPLSPPKHFFFASAEERSEKRSFVGLSVGRRFFLLPAEIFLPGLDAGFGQPASLPCCQPQDLLSHTVQCSARRARIGNDLPGGWMALPPLSSLRLPPPTGRPAPSRRRRRGRRGWPSPPSCPSTCPAWACGGWSTSARRPLRPHVPPWGEGWGVGWGSVNLPPPPGQVNL